MADIQRSLVELLQDLDRRARPGREARNRPLQKFTTLLDTVTMSSEAVVTSMSTPPYLWAEPYRYAVLADAPVAWWRLGDASGSTTQVDSGSGAHNATSTSLTLGATGALFGNAVLGSTDTAAILNGTNSYAASTSFDFLFADPNTVTIEAWALPTVSMNTTRRGTVYSPDNTAGLPQLEFGANAAGVGGALGVIIPGTFIAVTTSSAATINAWNHIVYVRRGAGATSEFWVNGSSVTLTVNSTVAFTNGASVKNIGRRDAISGTPAGQYFPGTLDEIAVYGTALSSARIYAHYQAGLGAQLVWGLGQWR